MNYSNEAGRRLCAAIMSHRLGVGVDYYLKNYVPGEVGEDWVRLARMIDECIADSMESTLSGQRGISPSLIHSLKAKLLADR